MTANFYHFGECELDRSRFELRHKGDNSRLVGKPYLGITSRLPVIRSESVNGSRLIWTNLVRRPSQLLIF
jgi:hypothetical protein